MIAPVTFEFETVAGNVVSSPKELSEVVPKKPGVFRIFDVHDNMILLEKTHNLAERVERFYTEERETGALDLRAITGKIEFCRTDSPFETLYLLHAERKRCFPATYYRMQTFPQLYLLKINQRQRFPRIYATRQIKPGVGYFGPFQSRAQLDRMKTTLERTFKIRPCEYNIHGNDPYPDCLYFQMRTCSKPCNGDINRDDYLADVNDAITFLEGRDMEIRTSLLDQIQKLARDTRYEDAARLRKRLERVESARKDHREAYFDLWHFNFIVVMESGSTKRRKVAFVNAGQIVAIEEHDVTELESTLEASIASRLGTTVTDGPPDQWYEDFCLVSHFMTHPIKTVQVVASDEPEDAIEAVIRKIEEDREKRKKTTSTQAMDAGEV